MKRSASTQDYDFNSDDTVYADRPQSTSGRVIDKRARSGSPPLFVGPLVFSADGQRLQMAMVNAQPSSMPGMHRLRSPQPSPAVRVWPPQLPQPLTTTLEQVLQAINGKCIFIFDTRRDASEALLGSLDLVHWLAQNEAVARLGLICSRWPQAPELALLPIPYVEDPGMALAQLCNFHEYLGPSAVLAKDGQVVATCMLSRSPEAILQTLQQWIYV